VDLYEIDSTEDEIEDAIEDANEDDLVGKALQKCARISVELKGELFGSSGAVCDRYSEVESSSVRIVTQVMVMVDFFLLLFLVVLSYGV
jgi:SWI/SNF-related matrix-associated actin-dependent regulator of chromatin subfamily A containing DEAD/H box 1